MHFHKLYSPRPFTLPNIANDRQHIPQIKLFDMGVKRILNPQTLNMQKLNCPS